jgi:hypothetical protein
MTIEELIAKREQLQEERRLARARKEDWRLREVEAALHQTQNLLLDLLIQLYRAGKVTEAVTC